MLSYISILALLGLSSAFSSGDSWGRSASYHTSMDLVGGFVLVEAELDGVLGTFILDTGAPGLILNKQHHKGVPSDQVQARGLSSEVEVFVKRIRKFEWLTVRKKHLDAYVVDLSHLEARLEQPIDGLIGYDILRGKELFIDYHSRVVQLFSGRNSPLKDWYDARLEVPVDLSDHLPVVKAEVNGRKFRLGIDSGAESNIFHLGSGRKFHQDHVTAVGEHEVRGLDQEIRRVPLVRFASASIKRESIEDLSFLMLDMGVLNSDQGHRGIDGLLGFPFLNSGKVSINYQKSRLCFWN
ncbi:MAG: pepsin/retropepsin-like aspartic protease family protein [Bacteroidota bacterium]